MKDMGQVHNMATTHTPNQQDYVMNVLLRQYCRASEENEILYAEMAELRDAMSVLFSENADLRFLLTEVGIELPPSSFAFDGDEDGENCEGCEHCKEIEQESNL
jgi:hypothetical protein